MSLAFVYSIPLIAQAGFQSVQTPDEGDIITMHMVGSVPTLLVADYSGARGTTSPTSVMLVDMALAEPGLTEGLGLDVDANFFFLAAAVALDGNSKWGLFV